MPRTDIATSADLQRVITEEVYGDVIIIRTPDNGQAPRRGEDPRVTAAYSVARHAIDAQMRERPIYSNEVPTHKLITDKTAYTRLSAAIARAQAEARFTR